MKAIVCVLGAIPTLAMTGCEMDLEETDEAGLTEIRSAEYLDAEFDAIETSAMPEQNTPDISFLSLGSKCNEAFAFINEGAPTAGHVPVVAYAYQQYHVYGPKIVQGKLTHYPITNGERAQGFNIDEQGFSGASVIRLDLVKNYLGRIQLPSSIRMKMTNSSSYLVNKSFSTKTCQEFANHATIFADSSDGSQLTMTYQWLPPAT